MGDLARAPGYIVRRCRILLVRFITPACVQWIQKNPDMGVQVPAGSYLDESMCRSFIPHPQPSRGWPSGLEASALTVKVANFLPAGHKPCAHSQGDCGPVTLNLNLLACRGIDALYCQNERSAGKQLGSGRRRGNCQRFTLFCMRSEQFRWTSGAVFPQRK